MIAVATSQFLRSLQISILVVRCAAIKFEDMLSGTKSANANYCVEIPPTHPRIGSDEYPQEVEVIDNITLDQRTFSTHPTGLEIDKALVIEHSSNGGDAAFSRDEKSFGIVDQLDGEIKVSGVESGNATALQVVRKKLPSVDLRGILRDQNLRQQQAHAKRRFENTRSAG